MELFALDHSRLTFRAIFGTAVRVPRLIRAGASIHGHGDRVKTQAVGHTEPAGTTAHGNLAVGDISTRQVSPYLAAVGEVATGDLGEARAEQRGEEGNAVQ